MTRPTQCRERDRALRQQRQQLRGRVGRLIVGVRIESRTVLVVNADNASVRTGYAPSVQAATGDPRELQTGPMFRPAQCLIHRNWACNALGPRSFRNQLPFTLATAESETDSRPQVPPLGCDDSKRFPSQEAAE